MTPHVISGPGDVLDDKADIHEDKAYTDFQSVNDHLKSPDGFNKNNDKEQRNLNFR